MATELRWLTEKREWESLEEYLLFLRHKKAYEFAGGHCSGKYVLDYGCGSGYGARVLADYAHQVLAVDVDASAIDHARAHSGTDNLVFRKVPEDSPLPFEERSFDVAVSLQVIEHIPDVRAYLAELRRVLKDDGELLLTTPNRKHRLLPFQKPWNPEHLREYSARQLRGDLTPVFDQVQIVGIHAVEKVSAIERRRVKQNPLSVYIRGPAARVLKAILPESIISIIRRPAPQPPRPAADPARLQEFSLSDFTIGGNPDRGLDLLAICEKA